MLQFFQKKSKRVRAIIVLSMVALLGAWVTGCGSQTGSDAAASTTNEAAERKVVRIGCVGEAGKINDNGGIAQELGYLEEELKKAGYELEVIGFAQAGPAINEAFASGDIDLAVYGDLPATVCRSNGVDIKLFATVNSQMQMCILAQKDSGIRSRSDLEGKKVIVAEGTIYHQYYNSLIEDAGIKDKSVERINTFADAASLMASGEADAVVTSASTGYYLEEQGIGEVVETTADYPEWTSQFFAFGKADYLENNGEAAKAVIRALNRAQQYVAEDAEAAFSVLSQTVDAYSEAVFRKTYAHDTIFDCFQTEITQEQLDRLKALGRFLEENALIANSVNVDEMVDTSYYEAVMQEGSENDV